MYVCIALQKQPPDRSHTLPKHKEMANHYSSTSCDGFQYAFANVRRALLHGTNIHTDTTHMHTTLKIQWAAHMEEGDQGPRSMLLETHSQWLCAHSATHSQPFGWRPQHIFRDPPLFFDLGDRMGEGVFHLWV